MAVIPSQRVAICLCVCVLTRVVQVITVALVILLGDPDIHFGRFSGKFPVWTFLPDIPSSHSAGYPPKFPSRTFQSTNPQDISPDNLP